MALLTCVCYGFRSRRERILEVRMCLQPIVEETKQCVPSGKARHFVALINGMYEAATANALGRMHSRIQEGGRFEQLLALTSVQLVGLVPSTGLYPSSSVGGTGHDGGCLSAGLPHFATHHMRCWGRDTFIALPGLMLATGRYADAREHILAFASAAYRGLIPNLLDAGRCPRYNARDATWWFLYAITRYCDAAPEGLALLGERVRLRFPADEYVPFTDATAYSREATLASIIRDILVRHAAGIHFVEWNAGPALDSVMSQEGFSIDITVDWQTGFVTGGNGSNCGTWMDKMGESHLSGNRGIPATPRDGAAVEIVALSHAVLTWLAKVEESSRGHPCWAADLGTGVVRPSMDGLGEGGEGRSATATTISFGEWARLIEAHFEERFYFTKAVPLAAAQDGDRSSSAAAGDGRRQRLSLYRDTVGSSGGSCTDDQVRPNYVVAMAISPALFDGEHARLAIAAAEECLLGPLGMSTLASSEEAYRPTYENGIDSTDFYTSRGFNYHNGPEWLWPLGFYLRAWMRFCAPQSGAAASSCWPPQEEAEGGGGGAAAPWPFWMRKRLQPHWEMLTTSPYGGLVELTNGRGQLCGDSCATQAWSMAALLELFV